MNAPTRNTETTNSSLHRLLASLKLAKASLISPSKVCLSRGEATEGLERALKKNESSGKEDTELSN